MTMSIPSQRQQLASTLRRLRETADLSTYALAEEIDLSQSRVSRLENARGIATPEEVRRWALACGETEEAADELAKLATMERTSTTPWRSAKPGGITQQQERVGERERDARVNRSFHPSGIYAGLLQTAWFVRHQLGLSGTPDLEAGIAARLARQRVLEETDHTFEFLLAEPALYWRPGPRQMQVAQLAHLRELMTLPNVTIGIIPIDVEAPTYYLGSFTLYEDRTSGDPPLVETETVEGERLSTDPGIVERYRKRLDVLRAVAVFDDAARELLDRAIGRIRSRPDQPERPSG